MVLTKEDRIELLVRARAAKASKKLAQPVEEEPAVEETPPPKVKKTRSKKEVPLPEPVQVIQEDESEEEAEVEVPIPAPKKKITPNKFLKLPKIEPQKCCDERVSHEQPLITDETPQVVDKSIIIPSKKQLAKPRQPRASTPVRTLDIMEKPKEIEEVMEEVVNNDKKYRPPQQRQAQQPPTPSAPIKITRKEPALRLFDY